MASRQPVRSELELRDYLWVLRRRKWAIILTTVLVAGVAVGYTLFQPRVYEAEATLVLEVAPGTSATSSSGETAVSDVQVETEAELMRSLPINRAIGAALDYRPVVDISTTEGIPSVLVTSRDRSPRRAARDANDFLREYVKVRQRSIARSLDNAQKEIRNQIRSLDQQVATARNRIASIEFALDGLGTSDPQRALLLKAELDRLNEQVDPGRVGARQDLFQEKLDQIGSRAAFNARGDAFTVSLSSIPTVPVEPRPVRTGLLALGVGLLLGILAAFLRDYFDDTIRTKEDLDAATGGAHVLSIIPTIQGWRNHDDAVLETVANPNSEGSEAYRSLRTALQFVSLERPIHIVHVTSSTSGEGKSTTSANLAVSLASAHKRVIVVDCDLRRPRLHEFFGVDNAVGFTSVLLGEVSIADAVHVVPGLPGLLVLPSGPIPPNPAELLSTEIARAKLEVIAAQADYVIVDSPPLLPVTDSVILAGYAHATILVVTAKTTTRRSLMRSLELLRQIKAPFEGLVLNGAGADATYGYGYGYGYGDTGSSDENGRGRDRSVEHGAHENGSSPDGERSEPRAPARASSDKP